MSHGDVKLDISDFTSRLGGVVVRLWRIRRTQAGK